MIELPEAITLSEQLTQSTAGKTINHVIARQTPHGFAFYTGDPDTYSDILSGRRINGATSFGGYVEIDADGMKITLSEGIKLKYLNANDRRPDKHQLLIEFDDGTAICCTVQMYGAMNVFLTNDNPYYAAAKKKPSPLSDQFSSVYFYTLSEGIKRTLSIKAFLATEQRIPGLGNGVMQDILFQARINPKRKMNTITDDEFSRLFNNVKSVLKAMTKQGGRDVFTDLYGAPGGYKTILSRKTAAVPCPVCGSQIKREAFLGGNIYYCPVCQPL